VRGPSRGRGLATRGAIPFSGWGPVVGPLAMRFADGSNQDYDGRPKVCDGIGVDELLERLLAVHGQEYADELLLKDAAMREVGASQIASKPGAIMDKRR
jgi:hypothetical protein